MTQEHIILLSFIISVVFIIYATAKFKLHAFYVLVIVSIGMGLAAGITPDKIIFTIKEGFGNTLASIGLVIVFGTTLGAVLEKTGAAFSMADFILRLAGEKRASAAMCITGFIFGIPIFCDSGFVVLSSLNKSVASRTASPMTVMGAVLGVGLFSVHCLIPPHPGATAAAGIFGIDLGKLMLIGLIVAIPTAIAGYLWVKLIGERNNISSIPTNKFEDVANELKQLPKASISFIPVFLPIFLISLKSVIALSIKTIPNNIFLSIISFVGDPAIALLLGLISSLFLLPKWDKEVIDTVINNGIKNAGVILLITAAGGSFGAILKVSGIGNILGQQLSTVGLGVLLPFLIAAGLKTAQGSSTVAIITAASLILPLLSELNLASGYGPMLTVLSMGAGSMVLSHANDSYFWVVTKFSNIDVASSLKVFSTATIVMGVTAEIIIIFLSLILY